MTTVLHIASSGTLNGSVSRAASAALIEDLAPDRVITRDLAKIPLPQVDEAWINARLVPQDDLSEADRKRLALSDILVSEVKEADIIVIGLAMYNFGMPAALKAWVDLVARPGVTFTYTENGPVGLIEGKRAIITMASGGVPVGAPADFATPHLEFFLNFIGINDVTVNDAKAIAAQKAA